MSKKIFFGILVIATAMSGAMLLSSCNHDDYYYSEEKVEQSVSDKYAIAFEKAFGKVGPNVDWGFSNRSTNSRALTRAGVAFNTTINFQGNCDASKFMDDVPATGVTKLPAEGGGANTPWFIDAETQSVTTWNTDGTLYVKGNVDLSNSNFDINPGWQIYLVKGSTLKLSATSAENLKGDYYIGKDATLETDSKLVLNSGAKIYIHEEGTIKVGDAMTETIQLPGTDGVINHSFIINNGDFECADVVVNGGAVQNIFDWTVFGTTLINSNNSGWINNGQWTTNNYAYVAGSENVINNCFLKVNNDFDMNVSSLSASGSQAFKINSGGSVETENFYGGRNLANNKVEGGPFRINMAEYSLFKVNNKATLESGRGPMSEGEVGFGFFGPSEGGYAVFQAKDVVRDVYLASINSHGAVTYGGYLYVSAETHFAQGYDSDGSGSVAPKPFIYEQDGFSIAKNIYAGGFKPGKPNITIEKTECSPGFEGGDPLYRVIAEDLSAEEAGDFDFNDVVFDVVKAEGGKTTLKLICAGGVLPLRVRGANQAEGTEIHSLFGETTPTNGRYKMYNTGAGPNVEPVEFTVDGTYTEPSQIKNIIIEVFKENKWMELKANRGEAACKILVDDTFKPVVERRNIADENQKFTDYVTGKFVNDFWWQY